MPSRKRSGRPGLRLALVAGALAAGTASAHATEVIGRSAAGRPITVQVLGSPGAPVRVLVVGSIHGDETAGIGVARRLRPRRIPAGVGVWVVADANPDGTTARTRQNARGVDLNRNFPFAWRDLGPRGTRNHAGVGAASEPETRALATLIREVRPTISVWFHQSLDLVDLSGGRTALSRRYAALVGMRAVRLARYPGSASRWQNRRFPGSTAFVVELPERPGDTTLDRHARAVLRLADEVRAAQ